MYDDPDIAYRRPRTGGVFFLSLFVSAITSAGVFFALREYVPAKTSVSSAVVQTVEVPTIIGMPSTQARDLLDTKGLLLTLETEHEDAKVPAGGISSQTPLAGSRVKKASEVRATVSLGVTTIKIPDVAGLAADKAIQTLVAAHLTSSAQDPETSATVPAGTVVGTTPAAGTDVAPASEVRLRVSSGASTIEVPKLTGLALKKAKDALTAAKLALGTTKFTYDEDRGGYIVLRQDPAAGAKVAPGTAINLVVNEGD